MRGPAPLWPAWEQVARQLAAAPGLALFSDFDGTLSPIARRPGRPRLPAATRRALVRLRRLRRVALGVVSGRSLEDLRSRVGLRGLYYIGSHGVEWVEPGGRRSRPLSSRLRARMRRIGAELQARLRHLPGIYVEHKTVSVAVHYRNASAAAGARARRVTGRLAQAAAKSLRLVEGKKVVELLPPGRVDKGLAVQKLAARLGRRWGRRPLVIYLGDDSTDETVFRRLGRGDVGIHIGNRRASRARYRLASPREVTRFLKRLREVVA